MLRFLQNYPKLLESAYDFSHLLLRPFRRWLKPGGRVERFMIWGEEVGKGAIFNCQMCGQCILHSTGMTCPMNCPKNLRNGPCGGVRMNGHCEVKPEMGCVWVEAFERSQQMPKYGHEMLFIQPPVNRQLVDTSAWVNMVVEVDTAVPKGWINLVDVLVAPKDLKNP